APVVDPGQTLTVSEDAANSTTLGTVTASDVDTIGSLTGWTITGGNDQNIFAIDSATGQIRVADNSLLDFESNDSYTLSVRVGDGVNTSANEIVEISVLNVAEVNALWFSTASDVTTSGNPDLTEWDEDQTIQLGDPNLTFDANGGTTAGKLSVPGFKISNFQSGASAGIEAMHVVWSNITIGDPGSDFDLSTGDLLFSLGRDGVTLNSETEPDKTFDQNDVIVFRPTALGDYSAGDFFHLLEDPLGSTAIRGISLVETSGGLVVGDTTLDQGTFLLVEDGNDEDDQVYTYTVNSVGDGTTSGTEQILLEGSSSTEPNPIGNLRFSNPIDGVHIVNSNTTIGGVTLQAGDLLLSTSGVPDIAGVDVDDQDITRLRMTTTRIGNNYSSGTAELLLDASDIQLDAGSSSEDINALTFVEGAALNHAVGPISDTDSAVNEIAEDAVAGTTVGITAEAADVDAGDVVTYSLDNNASNRFNIDPTTGVVRLQGSLDYESALSHEIVVRATSSDTSSRTLAFTIAVIDVNETPDVSLSSTTGSLSESTNTSSAIALASVTVSDDALGSETVTLSGDDAARFEVVGGQLRLRAGTVLDFESQSTYEVTVQVDDASVGGSPDDTVDYTLSIQDANDVATGVPAIQGTTIVGSTLTADTTGVADEDGLASVTYQYQWSRDGTPITGATNDQYTLTNADLGRAITVSVSFNDDDGNSEGPLVSAATSSIAANNVAPTLADHEINMVSGRTKTVPKSVFESLSDDVDGDVLSALLVTPPAVGTLNLQPNGRFAYTPPDDFVGTVSFQWQADDGSLVSPPATMVIEVREPRPIPPPIPGPPDPTDSDTTEEESEGDESDEPQDSTEETNEDSSVDGTDADSPDVSPGNLASQDESNDGLGLDARSVIFSTQRLELIEPTDSAVALAEKTSSDQGERSFQRSLSMEQRHRNYHRGDELDITRIDNEGAALHWRDMAMLSQPGEMWDELDDQRERVESQIQTDLIVVGSAGAAASSFTAGVVAWAMRSGFLVSGLVAHMPAWSGVDPLMIMQGMSGNTAGDQETLEQLMDRRAKEMESDEAES
ncbi:MAG: cadherin domain-containing protein, partial [Planctomycetota bacterium]